MLDQREYRGTTYYIHKFDTVSEYMEQEVFPAYKGGWRNRDSLSTDSHFTGTKTFEEAMELQRSGWADGARRVVKGLENASLVQSYERAPAVNYDVAGMFCDVPLYVAGDPYCMWDETNIESRNRPIVRLMVSGAVSGIVDKKSIENYGIALLSHIDRLEDQGKSVEVVLSVSTEQRGMHFCLQITVKNAGEPLAIDRLAFYLAHPSMLRRFFFRSIENHMPEQDFGFGYGSVTRLPKRFIDPGVNFLPGINYSDTAWDKLPTAIEKMNKFIGPDGAGIADEIDEIEFCGQG